MKLEVTCIKNVSSLAIEVMSIMLNYLTSVKSVTSVKLIKSVKQ